MITKTQIETTEIKTSIIDETGHAIWDRTLTELTQKLKKPTFNTWIRPLAFKGIKDNYAVLCVKNDFTKNLILQCYQKEIIAALKEASAASLGLRLIVDDKLEAPVFLKDNTQQTIATLDTKIQRAQQTYQQRNNNHKTNLIPELSFNNFINAANNEIATIFSKALLDNSSTSYKSIFIHSESGLGKTHLLHALGNYGLSANPELRIKYIGAEDFTNQLVTAIRKNQTQEFRAQFRNLDILLFDDLQFLQGKKVCQEEFYYSLDSLVSRGSKVFVAANTNINQLTKIDKKILSRINAGLISEIKNYSFDSRVAILQNKAAQSRLTIAFNHIELIARKYSDNIRELEGALSQLNAQRDFLDKEIDDKLICELFGGLGDEPNYKGLSIELISDHIADYFSLKSKDLRSKKRQQAIAKPRHIAMYLSYQLLQISYKRIGEFFGDRKHSSVIHSIRLVESELQSRLPSARGTQIILDELKEKITSSL